MTRIISMLPKINIPAMIKADDTRKLSNDRPKIDDI